MKTNSKREDRQNTVYTHTDLYDWAIHKAEADIILIMLGFNDIGIIN